MYKIKKALIIIGCTVCVLLVGSISASATDKLSSIGNSVKVKIQENKQVVSRPLVQVGDEVITNIDLLNLKAYKSVEPVSDTDAQLLEQLITNKLFLQLANEKNVSATLEEGQSKAIQMRSLLKSQPQKVQDTQKTLIAAMGITEEEYWNKVAPVEYQNLISAQNLGNELIKENVLTMDSQNPNDFGKQLKVFKHKLYESQLNHKVKVLDPSIVLN